MHYLALHKPYRVLSAFSDPEGRATLAGLVTIPGVEAAGRLDYDSEGLMILSDDGPLLHHISNPRHEIPKVYLAQVAGIPDAGALAALRRGLIIGGRVTLPAKVDLLAEPPELQPREPPVSLGRNQPSRWLRIVLHEGRKRQIRHMTAAVGYSTLRLVRVAIGPVCLGDLGPGQWRGLTVQELRDLQTQPRR